MIFLLFLLISVCHCEDVTRPIVVTPLGSVRGNVKTSFGGRKFSAFEGIPFAKPPIGEKRFKEPEPIEPWSGVWDANFLTECAQTGIMMDKIMGVEDCLYINVYVPHEIPNPDEKLEVIVHIHGGAYIIGSGHMYANPAYLMDRDIIFVHFNYRLGILGFLSTEDEVVPGNNGLKDQTMALKWIQENIASFGGNPDSVTLTGMSAGGSSVHFHYFSPLSKGLFHRGFSQSGVTLNSFSIQEEPLQKAKQLAHSIGCPTSPSKILVNCLKQRPFQQLLSKFTLFYGYLWTPIAPFAPVIEKGPKAFVDKNPYYLLAKGMINDVPWLVSNTAHEGLLQAAAFVNNLDEINEKWEEIAPYLLDYNYTLAKPVWASTAREIKEFYIGKNEKFTKDNFLKFVQIFSDRILLVDAETAVRMQSKVSQSPVYYYYFSYPGDHKEDNTVGHGEDAQYFFYTSVGNMTMKPEPKLTTNEIKMKDILLDMLIAFAQTNKPSIDGVTWEPTQYSELTYLEIAGVSPDDITLKSVKELTPRNFWTSLGFLENQNLLLIKDEL